MLISLESQRLSHWAQPPEVQFSGPSLRLAMKKEFCMHRPTPQNTNLPPACPQWRAACSSAAGELITPPFKHGA